MTESAWQNTTHDWAKHVDACHLEHIRQAPAVFAPSGSVHLVLEVLAYAADEAQHTGLGRAVVTMHADGSVSVTDNGRGTDTRDDSHGRVVKKPVMATKDMRFFDHPEAASLPDGHPRRGMSVVAALSEWLVHTNRRCNGAWLQRYERGLPVTELVPIPADGATGTTVHYLPDPVLVPAVQLQASELRELARSFGPHLAIEVIGEHN